MSTQNLPSQDILVLANMNYSALLFDIKIHIPEIESCFVEE